MKRALLALLVLVAGLALVLKREPPARGFGWIDAPEEVRDASAGWCAFAATEAYRSEYAGPDDVFLWDACRKVRGDLLPPRDQGSVGACVGFAFAAAVEHLICVQIAGGAREEYRDVSPEVIYAGSRVEIGGNRVRGDGSVGAWAARFVREYGVLPRGVYGRLDLLKYDPTTCRALGRTGVPDELEADVRKHPVRAVANVRTWDECRAAVRNGYPVVVCSRQGFALMRDADGFCRPSGTWAHAMAVVGVCGGRRPGGFLINSWGPDIHGGPAGPGNPSPAGFWADAGVLNRMLAQGDSWAVSRFDGFPARRLDWYAGVGVRRQDSGFRVTPAAPVSSSQTHRP